MTRYWFASFFPTYLHTSVTCSQHCNDLWTFHTLMCAVGFSLVWTVVSPGSSLYWVRLSGETGRCPEPTKQTQFAKQMQKEVTRLLSGPVCWVTGAEALWRRSSGDERRDAISTLSQRAAANVNDDRGHTGTEVTTEHRCGHSTRLLFTPWRKAVLFGCLLKREAVTYFVPLAIFPVNRVHYFTR